MISLSLFGPEQCVLRDDCIKPKPFEVCAEIDGEHIGLKGGVHGASSWSYASLRYLLDYFPSGVCLDLGSGSGEAVIYGAHHGWRSYGIEFCRNAHGLSIRNISSAERAGYIKPGLAKIAHGNFFPDDFQVTRLDDHEEDAFHEELERHRESCGSQNPHSTPYNTLGITLDEIDLFYHFQVERSDNILRLISERGKPGTKLFFASSFSDTFKVPDNIEIVASDVHLSLYEKRG